LTLAALGACAHAPPPRDIRRFARGNTSCYDRQREPFTPVVDSHVHFRPFNSQPIPFERMTEILRQNGVLFANVYGIGQHLPVSSPCEYYLDCIGTPALPSLKNDFANAQSVLDHKVDSPHLTLAMTFADLAQPDEVMRGMTLLDREYPDMYQ